MQINRYVIEMVYLSPHSPSSNELTRGTLVNTLPSSSRITNSLCVDVSFIQDAEVDEHVMH